jgi:hypothetical protein
VKAAVKNGERESHFIPLVLKYMPPHPTPLHLSTENLGILSFDKYRTGGVKYLYMMSHLTRWILKYVFGLTPVEVSIEVSAK